MDDFSPYQSPQPYDSRPRQDFKPQVVTWYQVYCGLMTFLYLLVALLGIFFLSAPAEFLEEAAQDDVELQIMGIVYGIGGLVFALVMAIGMLVPRQKWGWIYAIVMICFGLTSCCTLPFCIAMLIYWIKPETRQYFNA